MGPVKRRPSGYLYPAVMIKVSKELWLNLFKELRSPELLALDPTSCHEETLSPPQTVVEQACHCGTELRPVAWDSLLAFGGNGWSMSGGWSFWGSCRAGVEPKAGLKLLT